MFRNRKSILAAVVALLVSAVGLPAAHSPGRATAGPPDGFATAVGVDAGPLARVRVFDAGGGMIRSFVPYPNFKGGVRVAVGDLTGDGLPDLVTGTGPGAGPHVKIFDGASLALPGTQPPLLLHEWSPYRAGFQGGVFVAVGDVDGDDSPDVITAPGAGMRPEVRLWTHAQIVINDFDAPARAFNAFSPGFRGGVTVAAGDYDGDGSADIFAGPLGGPPRVRVFHAIEPAQGFVSTAPVESFFAFQTSFRGGVYVAAGDVDGDDVLDIVAGAGPGGGPHIRVFDGGGIGLAGNPAQIEAFLAFNAGFRGGVRVGAVDRNDDGRADIIVGSGPGRSHVRVLDVSGAGVTQLDAFFAFGGKPGLFVAADR